MAIRKIVKIDEDKCDGCGQCIVDCAEGALKIVDGKARLVTESYCDGLGECLGACPLDAITIEEREADAFDEVAVEKHIAQAEQHSAEQRKAAVATVPCACPGSALRQMERPSPGAAAAQRGPSQLGHWPIQLTLVPPGAPFLQEADLLLVADCVPFALADFHARFLGGPLSENRAVLVGCPKLDDPQSYVDKLADIFQQAALRSLTIIHMEVPCCTGLCQIARAAMQNGSPKVPTREVTISVDGRVIAERQWEVS